MPGPNKEYLHPPNAIATYDYADIITSTAYKTFYLGTTNKGTIGATTNYLMSGETFTSRAIVWTTALIDTSGYSTELDKDYDLKFNAPIILEGEALCDLTIGLNPQATAGTHSCYYIVKIRKWDGTTETEIVSEECDEISNASADSSPHSWIKPVSLTVPRTYFKIGDSLRVTIQLRCNPGGASCKFGFGQDPVDRNDSSAGINKVIEDADTTVAKIKIPFRPDL